MMECYEKGEQREIPVGDLPVQIDGKVIQMRVNYGSKIRNLMGFAIKQLKEGGAGSVVWTGSGNACSKTVTCAEILKRRMQGLHQFNHITYKRIEEYWEPKEEGLERLKVNRDIPVLQILLSKTAIQTKDLGYQHSENVQAFWGESRQPEKSGDKRKQRPRKTTGAKDSRKTPKQSNKQRPRTPKTDQSSEASDPQNRAVKKRSQSPKKAKIQATEDS